MEHNNQPQQQRSFTEYLVFAALLSPSFIVLGAAVVSLAAPDPASAVEQSCPRHADDYLP